MFNWFGAASNINNFSEYESNSRVSQLTRQLVVDRKLTVATAIWREEYFPVDQSLEAGAPT